MSDSPHISIGTQENFMDLVIEKSRSVPVLVDFWADWCAPCKNLMPVLAKLADQYAGAFHLVKVNSDEQQALAAHFGVRSLPTVKLFKDGQPVDEFTGALPEQSVREFLDKHLKDEIEAFLEQIDTLIESGDVENAMAALNQAREQVPDNPKIVVRIARYKLDNEDIDGAKELLGGLNEELKNDADVKALLAQLELSERLGDLPEESELIARIEKDPADSAARDQLSTVLYAKGDLEGAMIQLLEIVKRDRAYEEDSGRIQLIKLLEAVGNGNPLVQIYRRKLASSLN